MCYAAIPIVSSVLLSGLNIYGAQKEAKAQQHYYAQQKKIEEQNARIAENEAQFARQQAERNAQEKRKEYMNLLGSQRAKMGASGAVVDSGSFLDVSLSTVEEGEKDVLDLLHQGELSVWRNRNKAAAFSQSAEASMYKSKQLRNSRKGQLFGSTLLGINSVGKSIASLYK